MIYDVAFALDSAEDLRKAILTYVSDYEIYSYYLGHAFQIGKIMSSPFREDKKPSFNIYKDVFYNGLLHKDFGDARFTGDCFSFISQLHSGMTYKEAMQKVRTDVMLGRLRKYLSYTETKPTEKTTKIRCLIQYEPKYTFSDFEKKYWEDIGLNTDWRKLFKILTAKQLFVDGNETWFSTPDNPIFIYKIFDKIKAYRPFEKNKSGKWISNASRFDIQGWEQLPDINDEPTLIITKALKDVAVLRTLGYLAIAPSAESVMIPPAAMRILASKYGIKRFILLYDRDHGGMMGTKKMFNCYRGTYNMSFRFIGKGYQKDISDFRREYGEKITKRYLYYLLGYAPNEKLTDFSANAA